MKIYRSSFFYKIWDKSSNSRKITIYFNFNRASSHQIQFSLQNALHKTQCFTLPYTTILLNSQMFAIGQAYIVVSSNVLKIRSLKDSL
jgi:hypothetical protein